jgi:hypothetical protein
MSKEYRKRGKWMLCLTFILPALYAIPGQLLGLFAGIQFALLANLPIVIMNIVDFTVLRNGILSEVENLDNFEEFNTCVDQYTQVNIPVITEQINDDWLNTKQLYVVNWTLFGFMVATFIPLCMLPCYKEIDKCCAKNCQCCKKKPKK